MSWHTPQWWAFVILLLGAARLTRLIGWDDLTIQPRRRLTGMGDEEHKQWAYVIDHSRQVGDDPWSVMGYAYQHLAVLEARMQEATGSTSVPPLVRASHQPTPPVSERRYYLSKMIRCPWCLGWWITLAAWLCWMAEPRWTLILATPLALSEAVGLLSKNLDP